MREFGGFWGIRGSSYSWLVHVSWPATITENNWTTKAPKESDVRSLALRLRFQFVHFSHIPEYELLSWGQCRCLYSNGTGPWSLAERSRKFRGWETITRVPVSGVRTLQAICDGKWVVDSLCKWVIAFTIATDHKKFFSWLYGIFNKGN